MITFMRRYRRALQVALLIVIAAFVASLFVFGTMGGGQVARDGVATVNGESIPMDRYQRRHQEYLQAYSQIMRDRFSPELVERMGLPQQVVEDLVQEALVVQRAQSEGLAATDEELNAHIHTMSAFHEGGRFTLKRYEDILKRLGYSKHSFEDEMRRRLTRIKVENAIRGGAKVSDAEVEQAFVHMREEVRAAWALVELAPIQAAITVTDEELATFHKDQGAAFREPDRRRVQYVAVSAKNFVQPVTDTDVEKYYREHATEFETPRQVQASHILVRVSETGGSQAEDQARAKVADAIRRIKAGEDFAKLARELSQDPGSAPKGGELGWVSKGDMVADFESALLALRKGEVSPEPVRTQFGFHAVKVHDIREGSKKPLKDVAGQIRQRLAAEAAEKAARARAEEVRGKLVAAGDFLDEARKFGLTPVETTIARTEGVPGFTPPDPLEETAFNLAVGGVSTPVSTPAGWVVLKSVQSLPAAVPPLAEIKDKVATALKRQKAETAALEKAKQIATEAKAGEFTAAARKHGATVSETPRFSRSKPVERLPGDAMLAALKVPRGGVSEPVKTPQGYYVIKVLERVLPDLGALAAEREKIASEVLARKQGQAWQAWLGDVRRQAKIDMTSRLPGR